MAQDCDGDHLLRLLNLGSKTLARIGNMPCHPIAAAFARTLAHGLPAQMTMRYALALGRHCRAACAPVSRLWGLP